MATTRLGGDTFDHGAQYVTARSKEFKSYLDELIGLGYVARWTPRSTIHGEEGAGQMLPWHVGTPGMVSQWQKGEFEVVWPKANATAALMAPKPAWK